MSFRFAFVRVRVRVRVQVLRCLITFVGDAFLHVADIVDQLHDVRPWLPHGLRN